MRRPRLRLSVLLAALALAPGAEARAQAEFSFSPGAPVAGQVVTFTAGDDCDESACLWTGDGGVRGGGRRLAHAFAGPGAYRVRLTVVERGDDDQDDDDQDDDDQDDDDQDARDSVERVVTVAPAPTPAPPAPPAPAPAPAAEAAPPPRFSDTGAAAPTAGTEPVLLLAPFPVVRVAGQIAGRATRVRLVSVSGPRGATVRVRCRGASCPRARVRRVIPRSRRLRLRVFERTLRAGTVLEVSVTRGRTLGKFVRLRFAARQPPRRSDLCVVPGSGRRTRCSRVAG